MSGNLPDWLIASLAVAVCLAAWIAIAVRNSRRQVAATLARRPNPTQAEFLAMLAPDVSRDAAVFLWETARFYIAPKLTPHPDDDLVKDLPIDDGDWSMDWPRAFAEQRGFHESNLPDWPKDWPVTIRNFGRWLDMGPA